jgi:hypothetical protein
VSAARRSVTGEDGQVALGERIALEAAVVA